MAGSRTLTTDAVIGFATRASAAALAAAKPEISGGIMDQDRAVQVGVRICGKLLC